MYGVKLITISRTTKDNLSFTCDSYESFEDSCYTFNFGPIGCRWSRKISKSLVKSITKL